MTRGPSRIIFSCFFDLLPDVFLHVIEVIVDESAGLMIRLVDEAVFIDVDHEDFVRQILVNWLLIFVVKSCIDVIQIVVVQVDVEIAA